MSGISGRATPILLLDSEIVRCKFELILAAIVPQWTLTADHSLTRCFASF